MPDSTPRHTAPLPHAVLWDMDGTLVDTEPYWITAEMELAARAGGTWTHEDGLLLVGNDLVVSAQMMRERAGVPGSDAEIVEQLLGLVIAQVHELGIPWRPGAQQLLSELRGARIPCALVTMSYESLASVVVEALPPGTFDSVITGDAVSNGKPHPEPYLAALSALAVEAHACVAIEDSHAGIASAEAAGIPTLGVEFLIPIAAAEKRSRIASLEHITLSDLRRICTGEVIDHLAVDAASS